MILAGRAGRGRSLLVAVALVAAVGPSRPVGAQPTGTWPMFQHDLQHTGRSSHVGPTAKKVAWSFTPQGQPGIPAIASDGTIYLPAGMLNNDEDTGVLHALNPDGSEKWTAPLPGPPSSTAPAIGPDGTIYVNFNGADGNIVSVNGLRAIDPAGTTKWTFEFNDGAGSFTSYVLSSPAVAGDGTIWVGSSDTFLYALNPNGTIKCDVSPTVSSIDSSPAIAPDGTVYVIDVTNALFAISPTCDVLWDFQLADHSGGSRGSPSIGADGTVYAGSSGEVLYAVRSDGTLRCSFDVADVIQSTPAIATDGTIYVGADGLYALRPDCTQKWKRYGGALFSSASPVIDAAGTIYWRESWTAYAVAPDGGEIWQLSINASSVEDPGLAIGSDGHLYLGDGGGLGYPPRFRAISGTASPPTDREVYERTISLRLRRHLVAKGSVSSADPSGVCKRRPVVLQRRNFFGWSNVAKVRPATDGSYRVRLRDRAGRYRAKAGRYATEELVCKAAVSSVVRHRH